MAGALRVPGPPVLPLLQAGKGRHGGLPNPQDLLPGQLRLPVRGQQLLLLVRQGHAAGRRRRPGSHAADPLPGPVAGPGGRQPGQDHADAGRGHGRVLRGAGHRRRGRARPGPGPEAGAGAAGPGAVHGGGGDIRPHLPEAGRQAAARPSRLRGRGQARGREEGSHPGGGALGAGPAVPVHRGPDASQPVHTLVRQHADHRAVLRGVADGDGAVCQLRPVPPALQGQEADHERGAGAGPVPGLFDHDHAVLPAQADGPDPGRRGAGPDTDLLRLLRHGLLHLQGLLRHHPQVAG